MRRLLSIWAPAILAAGGAMLSLPDSAAHAQAGAVVRVSNAEQLTAALANYNADATIELAPGNYGTLKVNRLHTSNLTLVSEDPDNQAVFSAVRLLNSEGLTLQDIVFDGAGTSARSPFEIFGCKAIALKRITSTGPGAGAKGGELGLMIRDSSDISVVDSTFTQWRNGMTLLAVSDVIIMRNDFHALRVDGIRGGGWTNVTIQGNLISDFLSTPEDHPDGIQLWTSNQSTISQNVIVRENAILRGSGSAQQGIFVSEEKGNLEHRNFAIADNLILGGRTNSIYMQHASGVAITGNVAATEAHYFAAFRLFDVSGRMTGNSAYRFNANPPDTMAISGNTVLEVEDASDLQPLLTQWLAQHPATRAAHAGRSLVTQPL